MCDAATLATASIGGDAAGTAIQGVGTFFNARGEKIALESSAAISDINARIAELNAKSTIRAGQREEQKVRLQGSDIKEKQRVALAANNIDLSSRSAVNTLTTSDLITEIDANTVKANAARAAWGYRTEAVNFRNDAINSRAGSKSINPALRTGTTLLTGASRVSGNFADLKRVGAFKDG